MRRQAPAVAWAVTLFTTLAINTSFTSSSFAADLTWEVENPFRFFKADPLLRAA